GGRAVAGGAARRRGRRGPGVAVRSGRSAFLVGPAAPSGPGGTKVTGGGTATPLAGPSGATGPGILATGPDAGSPPRVHVIDAATHAEKFNFLAYANSFTGGGRVAVRGVHRDRHGRAVPRP